MDRDISRAIGNYECGEMSRHMDALDKLERDEAHINRRVRELTAPGADYDPTSGDMLSEALGDLQDLDHMAALLRDGKASELCEWMQQTVTSYAEDAARDYVMRGLGYGR